jgi:hypothetical protein
VVQSWSDSQIAALAGAGAASGNAQVTRNDRKTAAGAGKCYNKSAFDSIRESG